MQKISNHISYKEATRSNKAVELFLDNTPTPAQLERMKTVATMVFEPMRHALGGKPIHISSFFRSEAVNFAVGGSNTSDHKANKGAAIDALILPKNKTATFNNAAIFNYIKDNLDFDQLIWEYGTETEPDWVHFSFRSTGNRKQVLNFKKKSVVEETIERHPRKLGLVTTALIALILFFIYKNYK